MYQLKTYVKTGGQAMEKEQNNPGMSNFTVTSKQDGKENAKESCSLTTKNSTGKLSL